MSHELTDDAITIGRAPDNMIVIDDASVSGRHAEMKLAGESYELIDLGSTNGTRVNGQTITATTTLRPGDRIRFGKIEARLEAPGLVDSQDLPELQEIESRPAESSIRPVDFANASPFPHRSKEKDPTRLAIFAAVAVAVLAFLGSIFSLLQMQAPTP